MVGYLAPEPGEALHPANGAPRISVGIPAYQAAPTIGRALASIFRQTLLPHEVIVCDDGSTDDLDAALAPYRHRITLIRKPNGGCGSAKNASGRAATGDYVAWLDADDEWLPTRLERLSQVLTVRPDLDILTTDAFVEVQGKGVIRRFWQSEFPTTDQDRVILRRDFLTFSVVRRSSWMEAGGFDETVAVGEDYDCWVRLILAGNVAGLVPEPLYWYRIHGGNLSMQRSRMLRGIYRALCKALESSALDAEQHRIVRERMAKLEDLIEAADAREALLSADKGSTKRVWQAALRPGLSQRSRVAFAAAAALPPVARWYDRRFVRVG